MPDPNSSVETRLISYGSLAPGQVNHHQLAGLNGRWQRATVRGTLIDGGWGAGLGFPGLILDPSSPDVEAHLFESADLPAHWARLDAFEGPGYRRVPTVAHTAYGDLRAYVYVV